MDFRKFGFYGDYDFYDYDKLEKLNKSRSNQLLKLHRKFLAARDKGNENAAKKAWEAIRKHEEIDDLLKEKAREHHYHWY
jgi:hypothetical protein